MKSEYIKYIKDNKPHLSEEAIDILLTMFLREKSISLDNEKKVMRVLKRNLHKNFTYMPSFFQITFAKETDFILFNERIGKFQINKETSKYSYQISSDYKLDKLLGYEILVNNDVVYKRDKEDLFSNNNYNEIKFSKSDKVSLRLYIDDIYFPFVEFVGKDLANIIYVLETFKRLNERMKQ